MFPAARVTDQIVSTATQGAPMPIIPPGAPDRADRGHAGRDASATAAAPDADRQGLGDGDDRRQARGPGRRLRRPAAAS